MPTLTHNKKAVLYCKLALSNSIVCGMIIVHKNERKQ